MHRNSVIGWYINVDTNGNDMPYVHRSAESAWWADKMIAELDYYPVLPKNYTKVPI